MHRFIYKIRNIVVPRHLIVCLKTPLSSDVVWKMFENVAEVLGFRKGLLEFCLGLSKPATPAATRGSTFQDKKDITDAAKDGLDIDRLLDGQDIASFHPGRIGGPPLRHLFMEITLGGLQFALTIFQARKGNPKLDTTNTRTPQWNTDGEGTIASFGHHKCNLDQLSLIRRPEDGALQNVRDRPRRRCFRESIPDPCRPFR